MIDDSDLKKIELKLKAQYEAVYIILTTLVKNKLKKYNKTIENLEKRIETLENEKI